MHPARNWKPYVVIVGAALVFGLRVALQPAGVPFPPGSDYSDIVLAHWPNAEFVRRSLVAYGQLPLWNPNVLGGQPFAADPLAGISYPPDWLLFFLPLPLGFNLLYLAHLVWAGWGALRWLRAEGRSEAAALFGALLVMGLPKAAAHYGAGHFGLVQAVAWTPWLLLAVRRTDDTRTALRLGAVAALVFLADVRWCAYAGALTGAYWLVRVQRFERRALRLAAVAVGGFVAFGAVLWLPLAEFVRLSSRTSLTLDEASIFALGLRDLAGLVLPNFGGHHELLAYLGFAPVLLAALGATARRRTIRFWIAVAVAGAWWSLGASGGLFTLVFRSLPGLSLLRVPSRAWFVVALATAALAAAGIDRVRAGLPQRALAASRLSSVGTAAAAALLGGGIWLLGGRVSGPFVWLAAMAGAAAVVLVVWPERRVLLLGCLVLVDYAVVNASVVEMRAAPAIRAAGRTVVEFVAGAGLPPARLYAPSFSVPPVAAAIAGVPQLETVSPLQLASAPDWIAMATGVRAEGYSEVLPPVRGDARTANVRAVPSAAGLGIFNVGWVASLFPITAEGLVEAGDVAGHHLYFNEAAPGWASLAAGHGTARVDYWSPDRIVVRVDAPAADVLTIAQFAYPGWRARIDGELTSLHPPRLAALGDALLDPRLVVEVPPGAHVIELTFQPLTVYVGLMLSLLALTALGGVEWLHRRRI